jgi:hypothetical protein
MLMPGFFVGGTGGRGLTAILPRSLLRLVVGATPGEWQILMADPMEESNHQKLLTVLQAKAEKPLSAVLGDAWRTTEE